MLEKEKDRYRNAIQLLEKAQSLIDESVELIKDALVLVNNREIEDQASIYLLPQLAMAASEVHDHLGSNPCNMDSLMRFIHVRINQ